MEKILVGAGSFGFLVQRVQEGLVISRFDPGRIDGVYGEKTRRAVREFQKSIGDAPLPGVTELQWLRLRHEEAPSLFERCLQVTAAMEWTMQKGRPAFSLSVGNFDSAGLTWGVIGFTLASGDIGGILKRANKMYPNLLSSAAGPYTPELKRVLGMSRPERIAWGREQTLAKTGVQEPWRSIFHRLGEDPRVQREQVEWARRHYWKPAVESAEALGLGSEMGTALCFDIHVQNGHAVKTKQRGKRFEEELARQKPAGETERLRILAQIVADTCLSDWRNDVLARKLVYVYGRGTVHGYGFDLEKWGIETINN